MGTRMQAITPYNTSQGPSTEHDTAPAKVKVNFKLSKRRNIGMPDMLSQALHKHPPDLMDTQHFLKRSVDSKGHAYKPHWEPLRGRLPISGTKATWIKPHTSPPGGNPLGSHSNRKGDNPLGHYSGRHGDNPLGRAMNRVGTNAIGSPSNRTGEKSAYPPFRPRGGGGKP